MTIKFFAPRWGFENIPWESFLSSVKDAGYSGIEWFPFGDNSSVSDHFHLLDLLAENGLEFSIVTAVPNHYADADDYLEELGKQLRYLCGLSTAVIKPLFITAQTGREYYGDGEIEKTLRLCKQISHQTGIPIYQETHRNKWAYAAHAVAPFLDKHDDLLLTLDISHWFCVSESYLHDQQRTVEKAIHHTRHIHARVGHTQGPQVYDPGLPEYAEALEEHLKVWDKYVAQRQMNGASHCTITPEFGPPPYMVFANKSGNARDEQWRINLWIKDLLAKRFSHIE